MENFSR